MSKNPLIFSCLLLAATNAYSVEPASCRTQSLPNPLFGDASLTSAPMGAESDRSATVQIEAGSIEAQLGKNPSATMSGGVTLWRGDKLVGAETAWYDPDNKAIVLQGDVRYTDPGTQIVSTRAEFAYLTGRIRFEGARFAVVATNARGSADLAEINKDGTLALEKVEFTTCPPGSEDWLMQGNSIKLDTAAGVGVATGMKLRFKGVPILYAPYLSFPIGDARKSGVLTPEIGSAGRNGNEIRVPYYWNIAPNYDATITPRLLTSRGLQLETEFRYLTNRNKGTLIADYLPDDDITKATRHQVRFEHRTLFTNGWRSEISLRDVSDSQYYEDLGGSLSSSSITHLNRSVRFDYFADNFFLLGQIQDYQTIDDAILADEEPYRRLPQLLLNGSWSLPLGLRFGLDSELVNFDRDVGVTGWRVNGRPKIDLPISRPGWFVTPAVEFDYTRYKLDGAAPATTGDADRSLPIASLDTGFVLERSTSNSSRIQTLEPRLLYVNIPFRDQDGLPVFDTLAPDINLVQLYRKNRFIGVDRIGDTEQLSIGITSRVLDVTSGQELVTATIGQTRYYKNRRVTLPGATAQTSDTSDYIAELRFLLFKNVNFDIGHQWGSGADKTTQSEARMQYRPAGNKILNLAYRFRRDSLEQGDLSWSWPVATRWNFVGRYNFSFRDSLVLEQFFGLEYESCCWGLRLVSRRHISTRDGTRDSSFGLQLILKGMMSVGTPADKLLERGILGYSADLR